MPPSTWPIPCDAPKGTRVMTAKAVILNSKFLGFDTQFLVFDQNSSALIHNSSFLIQNSSFLMQIPPFYSPEEAMATPCWQRLLAGMSVGSAATASSAEESSLRAAVASAVAYLELQNNRPIFNRKSSFSRGSSPLFLHFQ